MIESNIVDKVIGMSVEDAEKHLLANSYNVRIRQKGDAFRKHIDLKEIGLVVQDNKVIAWRVG